LLDNNEPEAKNAKAILDALYAIDEVLGFNLKEIKEGQLPKEVALLIKKREVARKKKDFKTADKIRFDLAKKGIILEDQPDGGTRWKITQTH
jgi:cysteinyl-tRNA synthetase